MNRYMSIVCSVVFVGLVVLPFQVSAASITEYHATIGKDCNASGYYSTAMGYGTTASGLASTAMGYGTTASGNYSTAMGYGTTASGFASTATGYVTTASASISTVIGLGWGDRVLVNDVPYSFMVGYMDSEADTIPEFFVKNGAVGIGTKNPQNLLDLGLTQGKKLAVFQKTDGNDFYGFGISSATLEFYAGVLSDDTSPAMVVKKSTNRVGIGTKDPDYKLVVIGDARKTLGGTVWINTSDGRLKDVTGEYERGLEDIARLRPVTFFYKPDNPKGLPTDKENIGFIAQEVQEVFPEAVNEGPDGYLDFNMHPVNVALVNAVKELKAENETLRAENMSMREDIARIKSALGM